MSGAPLPLAPPVIKELSRDRSQPGFNFVFQGVADSGTTVRVIQAGGSEVAQAVVDVNGYWSTSSVGAQLAAGEFRFYAFADDGAGHVSDHSADKLFRPNVVLVNTDDMAAHDLSYMPTVSQLLVQSGTTFSNSFVPTSLSGPSRASLLTGLYAQNHGVQENFSPWGGEINLDRSQTIATWLQNSGYRTAGFGKWETVDESFGSLSGGYIPPGWNEFSYTGRRGYVYSKDGVTSQIDYNSAESTHLWTGMAANFIRETRPTDQPFFLYFAPQITHTPYHPLPRDVGTMHNAAPWRPPSYNVVPSDVRGRRPINVGAGDLQRERFLECLQAVDRAVGGIYRTLAASRELDNTVFVFTADNGLMWGEHGLINTKNNFYDESLRVPLVIRDGRAPLRQTASQMALNIDLAPTFAQMAGVLPGRGVDGVSLVDVVHGSQASVRTSFVTQHRWATAWQYVFEGYGQGGVGLRTDTWKYVQYESGKVELFNLVNDPYEMRNLAANPAYAQIRQSLAAQLQAQLPADRIGPEISGLSAQLQYDTHGKATLLITGQLSDVMTGGSEVRSPEYLIDSPGQPGWGRGMDTVDGLYNSPTEEFRRTVPADVLAKLSPGTHTVYVRGRDVHGNFGPLVSIQFTIVRSATHHSDLNPGIVNAAQGTLLAATENRDSLRVADTSEEFVDAEDWLPFAVYTSDDAIAPVSSDANWSSDIEWLPNLAEDSLYQEWAEQQPSLFPPDEGG